MTTRLQAIRKIYGDEHAGRELVAAFIEAGGDLAKTASALGISRTTMYRAIDELGVWPLLKEAIEVHGFEARGGRIPNALKATGPQIVERRRRAG
jgi:hypothetical protein